MCYPDGGRTGRLRTGSCSGRSLHIDCGHDDYFAAGGVPASAYLASHWNVAGCYDRFLVDYGCPGIGAAPAPPALRVVARRRTSATTVHVTVRLSRPAATTVSVSYTTPAGAGRIVFPRGHVTATLDLAAAQDGSSRLVLSDPQGLWLPSSLAALP